MEIFLRPDGTVQALHDDRLRPLLERMRPVSLRRASHVDPTADLSASAVAQLIRQNVAGSHEELVEKFSFSWWADLLPTDGPVLGPFEARGEAIEAEKQWLTENFFGKSGHVPERNDDQSRAHDPDDERAGSGEPPGVAP